ncbi:glycosyltransferase family 2 protein [Flavobacterium suncheonense]|uniref:Glycosyl transferase family 2 n=1 Tax=Flavobacterium suncheonense GH29-5 = DSM 17707 TaxID=1121899 RepID=A0A0A2MP80_9FLAO|nr:glycosyltransferase [Flavobacterium suncheonense]KGO90080.1 glycosyl transferase family 2 [Flavobacterium suncheonense GH29-5 = DSM 17707]
MLSILIPTYNYNVYPLVEELKKQADALQIMYEILVQDDHSTLFLKENSEINTLVNCYYTLNTKNLGRGNNINALQLKAKFEYVLILEADALPKDGNYLANFIKNIFPTTEVIFGGVVYPETKPQPNQLLRWKYGCKRESIALQTRLKKPFHFVFTWNLLLKKEILNQNPFPNSVREYGYEDVVFLKKLKEKKVHIQHIDNPLIHYNQESNLVFINKTETAIRTLKQLMENKELDSDDTRIGKTFFLLKQLGFDTILRFLFLKFHNRILSNLTSTNPSLLLLDLYKLGYLCNLDNPLQSKKK